MQVSRQQVWYSKENREKIQYKSFCFSFFPPPPLTSFPSPHSQMHTLLATHCSPPPTLPPPIYTHTPLLRLLANSMKEKRRGEKEKWQFGTFGLLFRLCHLFCFLWVCIAFLGNSLFLICPFHMGACERERKEKGEGEGGGGEGFKKAQLEQEKKKGPGGICTCGDSRS